MTTYKIKNRPKAFIGAAIGAVTSIAGSVLGGAASRKQARKQAQLQAFQNATTTGQSYADMLNSLQSNSSDSMYNEIAKYGKSKNKNRKQEIEAQDGEIVYAPNGLEVSDGGMAIPIRRNTFLLRGSLHDEINESGNTGIGLKLSKGHIISNEPMFTKQSPAKKVLEGESIQDAVAEQTLYKQLNNINEPMAEHGKTIDPFFKAVTPYNTGLEVVDNSKAPKLKRNVYRDTKLSKMYYSPYNNYYYNLGKDAVNSVFFTPYGEVASSPVNPTVPAFLREFENVRGVNDRNSRLYDDVVNTIRQPRKFYDSIKTNVKPFTTSQGIKLYPVQTRSRKKFETGTTFGFNTHNWKVINGMPFYKPESQGIIGWTAPINATPKQLSVSQQTTPTNTATSSNFKLNDNMISAGISGIGNLVTGLINNYYLNKISAPSAPTQTFTRKLKTDYNINPQITEYNNQKQNDFKSLNNNVSSSAALLQQRNKLNTAYNNQLDKLYSTQETEQAKLINQDLLNQQENATKNVAMYNDWLQRANEINNNKLLAKADNVAKTIGGLDTNVNSYFENNRIDKQNNLNMAIALAQAKNPEMTIQQIRDMLKKGNFLNLFK